MVDREPQAWCVGLWVCTHASRHRAALRCLVCCVSLTCLAVTPKSNAKKSGRRWVVQMLDNSDCDGSDPELWETDHARRQSVSASCDDDGRDGGGSGSDDDDERFDEDCEVDMESRKVRRCDGAGAYPCDSVEAARVDSGGDVSVIDMPSPSAPLGFDARVVEPRLQHSVLSFLPNTPAFGLPLPSGVGSWAGPTGPAGPCPTMFSFNTVRPALSPAPGQVHGQSQHHQQVHSSTHGGVVQSLSGHGSRLF